MQQNIPNHVVIIPDGNRRWARSKGWLAYVGHRKAASLDRIVELFYSCKNLKIQHLSVWGFSTENWSRDTKEISEIFDVLLKSMDSLKTLMHKEQIRFRHIGRKDRIPADLILAIQQLEEETKNYTLLNFNLLLDYGGRNSIVEAVNKIIESGKSTITESDFSNFLDTKDIPDADLIIRTSGEYRTSGIMPYESVYSELYFTDVLFPDFDGVEFKKAIDEYSNRTRRFGGTSNKDLKNVDNKVLIDPDNK